MKSVFVLMILAVVTSSALGQTPTEQKCSLTLAQSPVIRGLKLGMDMDEVLRQFPGRSEDPYVRSALLSADSQFGLVKFHAPTYQYKSEKRFEGISQFDFEFLDKRLTSLSVQYQGPEWNNVDEFVSKVAEPFNLPSASYWTPTNGSHGKTLKCAGFEVWVFVGGGSSSLQVRNPAAEQIRRDRQTEAKERARKEFKP